MIVWQSFVNNTSADIEKANLAHDLVLKQRQLVTEDRKMMIDTEQLRVVITPQKLERKVESGKMSPEFLKEHCRKNDLYMIPKFNTILYLHHKVGIWAFLKNQIIALIIGIQRY